MTPTRTDQIARLVELEKVANEWMKEYDKMVAKYEPLVAVTSCPCRAKEK